MTTINVIRYSDGRTIYNCRNSPYPPTNPKAGTPSKGNTITWNEKNRVTTLIQPRLQDEYVTGTRTTPVGGTYPTTTQHSPYFTDLKKTGETDKYGRKAVTLYEKPKPQTIVSRYSTDSLSINCTPKITANCSTAPKK